MLEKPEHISRSFEQWLGRSLARLPDGRDRALVAAYARWEIMPRLRRPSPYRRARPQRPQKHPRSLVTQAIELTAWLAAQDLCLGDLRQDLLDTWVGEGPSTRPQVRLFCAWLARSGAAPPLRVEWKERGPSPVPLEAERRLTALRVLLHEDRAAAPERVAGCLLLLFGQPLTRSVALRAADIGLNPSGQTTINLGRGAVALPESLGSVALDLRERALLRGGEDAWLFPGRIAGAHLSAETLRARLRRYGISAKAARRAALLELAARLPAPILAERFGFHPARAARWVTEAGKTYADYVALRAGS